MLDNEEARGDFFSYLLPNAYKQCVKLRSCALLVLLEVNIGEK